MRLKRLRGILLWAVLAVALSAGAAGVLVAGWLPAPPGSGMCNEGDLKFLKESVDPIVHGTGRRLLETGGCNEWDDPLTYGASYAQLLDCPAIIADTARTLGATPQRNTKTREDLFISEGSSFFDTDDWRIHLECGRSDLYFVAEPR